MTTLLLRGVARRNDLPRLLLRRGKAVDGPRQVETVIDAMTIDIDQDVTETVIHIVIVVPLDATGTVTDIVIDLDPVVLLDATGMEIGTDTNHPQEMKSETPIDNVHAIAIENATAIAVDLVPRMASLEEHQVRKTKREDIQIEIPGTENATYEIKSARSDVAEDEIAVQGRSSQITQSYTSFLHYRT